jgi:carboxyl-terminal processing protease
MERVGAIAHPLAVLGSRQGVPLTRSLSLVVPLSLTLALVIAPPSTVAAEPPKCMTVSTTILLVKDHYLDPGRIAPKKMLVAAVEALSRFVPELLVEGDESSQSLTLRMGAESQAVDLTRATSVWAIRPSLCDALEFVRQRTSIDGAELERAAANGMVSALDNWTVVLPGVARRELGAPTKDPLAGVGLVIGLRHGQITVIRALPGTDAERIGLRKGDRILDVGGHSTIGVDLQKVVGWLLGPPASTVKLSVARAGEPVRILTAYRANVPVSTVEARRLPDGLAYVHISQFTGPTRRQLAAALRGLRAEGGQDLRGVVLDLRNNSGGLLTGAASVADAFLAEGTIVEQVGQSASGGSRHAAKEDADDVLLPVVVLVNGSTASGAELVAAALRDNGHAILVGQRTFGLGMIQQLVNLGEDEASGDMLKVTVAQLRTPSGFAFHGVGLEPDVVTRPGRASRDRLQLFAPISRPEMAGDAAAAADVEPVGTLRYLVADALDDDENEAPKLDDPAVAFAAQVLARAKTPDRDGLRAAAAGLLPERQAEEDAKLAARLSSLGIDWTHAESADSPAVNVTTSGRAPGPVAAGAPVAWTVTVENRGPTPLSRLRAWTVAPHAQFLDRRELVFGTLPPGAKRSYVLQLSPQGAELTPRRDDVTLRFEEENGHAPPDATVRFELGPVSRPRLAASVQLACPSPKCSRLTATGDVKVAVSLRNTGGAPSRPGTVVELRPLDESLYVTEGRQELGTVPPRGQKRGTLAFRLSDERSPSGSPSPGAAAIRFRLVAADLEGDAMSSCEVEIALGEKLPATRECPRVIVQLTPDPDAALLESAGETFHLAATASVEGAPADPLRRLVVYLKDRKVLVQPAAPDARRVELSADLHLEPGENLVQVLAETRSGELQTRRFRVYRR